MNLPEREIMRALREGRREAFKQAFDTCFEGLCRYAFTLVRDEDEAADIVQSMFVKLWERRAELDIKHAVRPYLFRSVYNQCMNQLEHRTVRDKHRDHSELNLSDSVEPEVFKEELDEKIKEVVDKLPPQCRTIFIMSRYEELKYPEIAEKLNISVNTIQNQICKALKILREELKEIIDYTGPYEK
jgi:RNA polymerase sigma-70 factor (ECF subfamily)